MLIKVLLAIATILIVLLLIRVILLRKAFKEIEEQLEERIDGDTITPITLTTRDKSARKLADVLNKEIEKLNTERIKYENSNREMNKAVTNISHDLRTPLTAMNSYVDLIMKESDESVRMEYLSRLKNRTELMSELTEELFNYTVSTTENQITNNSKEHFALNALLQDSLLSFYNSFKEKGITPEIIMPEESVIIYADKKIVYRIFENIISNAVKYSSGNFKVELKTDSRVIFSNYAPELSKVDMERMFDRFYTVKNSSTSTGLGLAISKELINSQGGNITHNLTEDKMFEIIVSFIGKI